MWPRETLVLMLQQLLLSWLVWRTCWELTKGPCGDFGEKLWVWLWEVCLLKAQMWSCGAEHPEGVRGCMRLCPCTTRQLGTSSVCGALFLHYFIPLPLVLSMFECSWKRGNRNFSVCPWQPLPVLCTLFVAYEFLIFISTTFSLWL